MKNNYYTIAKTLLLIFIVTLSSCERDLDLKEPQTEINESQFEKLNGFFNAEGKIITPMQLPDAFKNKLFAIIDIKVTDKQSQQAILQTYFESKVSVIKVEEGLITYALPIKHNAKIKNKFKKTLLSKATTTNICDDSLYEVFALNIDSQTGAAGDLNLVSFSSSYASDYSGGNTGVGTGLYSPTLIYTTILNTSTGNSSTFSTPRSNSSFSNDNNFFSGIWNTISNITNSIGNFFNNIFRGVKCHCAGGPTRKFLNLNKSSSIVVPACDCGGTDKKSKKTTLNAVEFDFSIPLPDSFLNMSALGNITADCDCKFRKIDVKNSSEAIKKDYFDCSCNSDSVDGVAILLNLSAEQSDWLGRFENIEVKSQICKFIKDSNYNDSSLKFAKEIIEILKLETTVDNNALTFVLEAQKQNKLKTSLDADFVKSVDQYADVDLSNPENIDPLIIHFTIQCAVLRANHPTWSDAKIYWEASKEFVHISLDVLGLVPVVGEVADLTNGALYTIEGEGVNATLSFASSVPLVGWASVGVKYAVKIKTVAAIGTKVKLTWKVLADGTIYFGTNNTCRAQLRKALGLAVGNLNQAHHIIPLNMQTNTIVQKAFKSGDAFHLNEALNGIPLSNAVHSGSHFEYDKIIKKYLDAVPANSSPRECYDAVAIIINRVRIAITKNPNTPINQLIF